MKYFNNLVFIAVCTAFLFASSADAAIYFRDKEVLRDGKMEADIERLYWAPVPNSTEMDRIQGHLSFRSNNRIYSVMLVFQSFDSRGKLLSSFSISPRTCEFHPSNHSLRLHNDKRWADARELFPLCGVEKAGIKVTGGERQYEWYKDGINAWFYADFPRDKNAQSMRVVNVVIDGKEVQYNVRFAANKLVRYNAKPPEIKHGTEAELGDEDDCAGLLPEKSGADAAKSSNSPARPASAAPAGRNDRGVAASAIGEDDEVGVEASDADAMTGDAPSEPLHLDASSLSALRSGFTGKAYKCKTLLDEFAAAVGQANGNAEEKRMKLDRAVSGNLEKMLAKAQSEGQLDLALAITTAISAFPERMDAGGSPEIAKVFGARQARLAQIDRELAQDALAAVKTFNAALEEQKGIWTKKGELDVAKNIADFQRALSTWTKDSLAMITAPRGKSH